jgi:hypothetical protein
MRKYFLLLGLFCLIACGAPPDATPVPTPEPVRVAYTPALRPLRDVLTRCIINHPEMALYLVEVSPSRGIQEADILLRLGYPPEGGYVAQIGWESIVVIVNGDHPVTSLSAEELSFLFSGRVSRWEDGTPVHVWIYPEGDDTRQVFDAVILNGLRVTPEAQLAPDPQAMLEAVSGDPLAIGYLPQRWLPGASISIVRLNQELADSLRQPVLSLSSREPDGAARPLLFCLQASLQP